MNKIFYQLKESRFFQLLVISIIIFNAFTIGVNTYEISEDTNQIIKLLIIQYHFCYRNNYSFYWRA